MKEELNKLRGEFILCSIELENSIEGVIAKAIHGKYVNFMNSEIIFDELNFERKIKILSKIFNIRKEINLKAFQLKK